ncbi:putative nuclease HARBI1 [Coccinella septempunctata]|uniref:putative nuclease HARBI1 n=1 Tax=Coccinella septempunctata TaxID=41139 RepID=UPI001D05CA70|nr:putative nuclease HARBI1 [Coccinella septempunctata]
MKCSVILVNAYKMFQICDESLKIMHVNSQFPGSTHDAYIWNQSNISYMMQKLFEHDNNNNFFLLGDSGYPLRPWLITPLKNPEPGTAAERFNRQFTSVRSKIEQCNGVLKNRFRCLLKHRVLHYKPIKAARIVKACVVLHNICIDQRIPEPYRDDDILNADFCVESNIPAYVENAAGNVHLHAGRELRLRIINNHFN